MRKLLLFFAMLCVSIGAWAEQVSFGSEGSWYEIDGTTLTIYVAKNHDLGNHSFDVLNSLGDAKNGITKIVYNKNSNMSGSDAVESFIDQFTSVETIDLSGVTLQGADDSYYFGSYDNVKSLILADVTADKLIEIAGNSALQAALVTPTTQTTVKFSNNNSENAGIIINEKVTKDGTFANKWIGTISSFETYNQDFIPNATTTTAKKLIVTGTMSSNDTPNVSILSNLSEDIRLLDMSGVTLQNIAGSNVFPFGTNPHLYSVVLPQNLEDVQAWWFEGCTNLYAAISYDTDATRLVSYVKTPGRLKTTILDAVKGGNTDFASDRSYIGGGISMPALASSIDEIKLSGTLNAVDISSGDVECIDSEGHVGYQGESTESQTDTRTIVGTKVGGTLTVAGGNSPAITTLDLSGAYFPVYTDMTLTAVGYTNSAVKKVLLPTDSRQNIIPAYMFNGQFQNLFEICIPSNYEVIKTCAFAKSGQGFQHIWTTDANPNVTVDNGVTVSDGTFYEGYEATDASAIGQYTLPKWGTYTFSSNLKLIESYAFASQEVRIKDVYVLALETPECHVDAFNVYMYIGQSGFGGATVGGIVTREAYKNGNVYLTMLHYPRDCDAPYIQRYTDMGREYSIATGEVDGKGANIYYPTYGEFLRAYTQGTYGYLWNSMDDTRANGDLMYNPSNDNKGWSASQQGVVNNFVTEHPGTYTSGTKAFSDAIFYDVTLGGNTKPAGMKDYWEVTYGGTSLYPRNVESEPYFKYEAADADNINELTWYTKDSDGNYTQTSTWVEGNTYTRVQEAVFDANGNPTYKECTNGAYIIDQRYVEDAAGELVENYVQNDSEGNLVQDFTYEVNAQGDLVKDQTVTEDPSGTSVKSYSFNVFDGTTQEGVKYYYHPFVAISDNNQKDQSNLSQYYYFKGDGSYTEDPNGIYINNHEFDGQDPYYDTVAQFIAWGTIQPGDESKYTHYSQGGSWVQVTTVNNDFWQNTLYKKSSEYKEYVSGANDYLSKIDGTLYTKDYDSPVTYRDATNEDYTLDASGNVVNETLYIITDNGYRVYDAATDGTSVARYKKTYASTFHTYDATNDADEVRYLKESGYRTADNTNEHDAAMLHYSTEDYYRLFVDGTDDATVQRYCPNTTDATFTDIIRTYDYRGWHQFVLNGFAANTELEVTQHRSYLTDNDWWTICLPYDLTYSEMMFFYGTVTTDDEGNISMDETKIPYLSQLVSVTRDMTAGKITLNFSKNLMNHSQVKNSDGDWVIGDEEDATIKSEDKVVLHAGVPYMIRPYRTAASDGSFTTQFDIYGKDNVDKAFSDWRAAIKSPSLYEKLKAAEVMTGETQMSLVKNGLVTVPALVTNIDSDAKYEEETSGTVTIGTNDYAKSSEFDYTFVGSFYKSFLPPYCYYLGYKNGACFFYADIERTGTTVDGKTVYPDLYETMKWNNNTCIIVPNMLSNSLKKTYNLGLGKHAGAVTPASGSGSSMVPAQWVIGVNGNSTTSVPDDLKAKSGSSPAKAYTMVFGVEQGEIVTGIREVTTNTVSANDDKVYTLDGQQVKGSTLPKGLYIKNGKKIIVK